MYDRELFARVAEPFGVEVTPELMDKLGIYARLLVEWNEKMNRTEIATRSGFNSSSYFCKVFKAEKGVSPTVYRKNLRGK